MTIAAMSMEFDADLLNGALETIERSYGLEFPAYKREEVKYKLKLAQMESSHPTMPSFLEAVRGGTLSRKDLDALLKNVTVGESYFFRHDEQLDDVADLVVPDVSSSLPARNETLKIWCAGCATGEEPYSLAIKLEQRAYAINRPYEIVGTDLNPMAIEKAIKGTYEAWSMRDLDPDVINGFFARKNGKYALKRKIRNMARFERQNLAGIMTSSPFGHGPFTHLILCRNVIYYFSPSHAERAVQRFYECLAPGGYLVLSPSESLLEFEHPFQTLNLPHAAVYRKMTDAEEREAAKEALGRGRKPGRNGPRARRRPLHAVYKRKGPDELEPSLAISRAMCFYDGGQWNQALKELEPLAGNLDADLARLEILQSLHNSALLDNHCEWMIKNHPSHVSGYYCRALLAADDGDLKEALSWLGKVMYLDSDFVPGHLQLAAVYGAMGKQEEAGRAWRSAKTILSRLSGEVRIPFTRGETAGDLLRLISSRED